MDEEKPSDTDDAPASPWRDSVRLIRPDEARTAVESGAAVTKKTAQQRQAGPSLAPPAGPTSVPRFPAPGAGADKSASAIPARHNADTSDVVSERDGQVVIDLRSQSDEQLPESFGAARSINDDSVPEAMADVESTTTLSAAQEPESPGYRAGGDVLPEAQGEPTKGLDPVGDDQAVSFSDHRGPVGLDGSVSGVTHIEQEDGQTEQDDDGSGFGDAFDDFDDLDDNGRPRRRPPSTRAKSSKEGTRFRKPEEASAGLSSKFALLKTQSLAKRVGTGLGFAALAVVAFIAGPTWVMAFSATVVLAAAGELFDALRRIGYRPATLLALVAVAGTLGGSYSRGETALGLMTALMTVFSFLWFLTGASKAQPTANIAITMFGFLWTGVLGSYAALLLRMPNRSGMAFLGAAILITAAYDTAAYLGGSVLGKHRLAPTISPGKTWEGLAVGTLAAAVAGAAFGSLVHPWTFASGMLLGLLIAVVAPVGDLSESMVKRDLGLKDMSRILPGHGGILDRFDAMLFVLPATYYLVRMLDLA